MNEELLTADGSGEIEKVRKLLIVFSIVQPIVTAVGITVLFAFSGIWYWMAFFALIMCYAGFGVKAGDIVDGFVKKRYPQYYKTKDRPSNRKIKEEAKKRGDKAVLALKAMQRQFFIICAACIAVFAVAIVIAM